jgi:hypothetical protein
MALHTLEELHNKTADYISDVVNHGFRIDPDKSVSDDPHIFNVTLYNKITKQSVEICTKEDNDSFTRSFNIYCSLGGGFGQRFSTSYYKVHDNIYADTEDEAKEEHKKWLATNLGLGDIGNKDPIQAFADMLGNHICKCLHGGK